MLYILKVHITEIGINFRNLDDFEKKIKNSWVRSSHPGELYEPVYYSILVQYQCKCFGNGGSLGLIMLISRNLHAKSLGSSDTSHISIYNYISLYINI